MGEFQSISDAALSIWVLPFRFLFLLFSFSTANDISVSFAPFHFVAKSILYPNFHLTIVAYSTEFACFALSPQFYCIGHLFLFGLFFKFLIWFLELRFNWGCAIAGKFGFLFDQSIVVCEIWYFLNVNVCFFILLICCCCCEIWYFWTWKFMVFIGGIWRMREDWGYVILTMRVWILLFGFSGACGVVFV